MKRTTHARFINVGKDSPEYVDKHRTSGKIYTEQERIQRELKGIPEIWYCELCEDYIGG